MLCQTPCCAKLHTFPEMFYVEDCDEPFPSNMTYNMSKSNHSQCTQSADVQERLKSTLQLLLHLTLQLAMEEEIEWHLLSGHKFGQPFVELVPSVHQGRPEL